MKGFAGGGQIIDGLSAGFLEVALQLISLVIVLIIALRMPNIALTDISGSNVNVSCLYV